MSTARALERPAPPAPTSAPAPRLRRLARLAVVAGAAASAAWLLAACEPAAVTFTVTTTVDGVDANIGDGVCATATGQCTVRAAVQEGNTNTDPGPVEIALPVGRHELTIPGAGEDAGATGDLDMTRAFRFKGADGGPLGSTLAGGVADRLVDVHPGARLEVNDTHLEDGQVVGDGGLIRAVGGNLSIARSSLVESTATGAGGLVSSDGGTLTVVDTGFENGDAQVGGSISADRLVMSRSSILQGSAVEGGAVLLTDASAAPSSIDTSTVVLVTATNGHAIWTQGTLVVRDSTMVRNVTTAGVIADDGTVSVGNSVLAAQDAGPNCGGPLTSLGNNLDSGSTCGLASPTDAVSVPAGPLEVADLGTTWGVRFVSPRVVDAGGGCAALDQVKVARPADGDTDGLAECDRGALESDMPAQTFIVTTPVDAADLVPGDGECATSIGQCTLRAAVQESNALPPANMVVLDAGTTSVLSLPGAGEDLGATGDLDITDDLRIVSDQFGTPAAVDANDLDRVFDVHAGTVSFERLIVNDGTEAAGGGAVRTASGSDLTVSETWVFGNVGSGGGGGIRAGGTVSIVASTLSANQGGATGGGVLVLGTGAVSVTNSTIASNLATEGSALTTLAGSTATVVDSTIASNTGGVGLQQVGPISLRNTIVANHASGNCSAAVTSFGHNIDSGASCGLIAAGDAPGTNPLLGSLGTNGGVTLTMKPGLGSPAIGSGACASATDQRGIARPQGGACDKGSVEQ